MAEFFHKFGYRITAFLCGVILFVCGGFSIWINSDKGRFLSLYFLIDNSENVEVGAILSSFQGGAGYLLEVNGCEYAVHTVYLSEEKGQRAVEENSGTTLFELQVKKEWLSGAVYDVILILEKVIDGLNSGWTQEKAKRVLLDVGVSLKGLSKTDEYFKAPYEKMLAVQSGILLAKDLRYIVCLLADGIVLRS